MASVAEQLRRGREAARLSVSQVADITKMKTDHVRALEEGNYDAFVAAVYIRGFVRTYAGLLKLDVAQILATLEAELGQTARFRAPPALSRESEGPLDRAMLLLSRVPWRVVLPVLGVVAVVLGTWGGISLWQEHRARNPLEGIGPGLYQPAQRPSGEVLPLPAAPAPAPATASAPAAPPAPAASKAPAPVPARARH